MPQAKDKIFEIDDHIMKRFDIKKRLGKGAYGIVWKAIDRKTKEVVAVKKIFDAFRNQTDAQRTFREIMFLQSLKNHPNIIQLYSIHRAANNSDIYLGFEYMETDLHNVIKRGILKDIHKRYIMYQLLKAIKYIHSGNVIHRDLKPSNILLDVMCRCKIADFGLARSLTQLSDNSIGSSDSDPPLTDYVATRWYRAPEILIANRRYTKGIDMWSLGCILAEITAGKPIFPGSSTVNQVEKIMATIPTPSQEDISIVCISGIGSSMIKNASSPTTTKIPLQKLIGKDIPKDALHLINKLLVFNPIKRLKAEEALQHQYVASFHDPSQEIVLDNDIIIPFNDDVRFSIDDYRDKLYELMATHHHHYHHYHHQHSSATNNHNNNNNSRSLTATTKLAKNAKLTRFPTKTFTTSEPKISSTSKHLINNIKSDSRVTTKNLDITKQSKPSKCKVQMKLIEINKQKPKFVNITTNINNNNNNNNNKNNIINRYNQTHGIIGQSTLMELKATALR